MAKKTNLHTISGKIMYKNMDLKLYKVFIMKPGSKIPLLNRMLIRSPPCRVSDRSVAGRLQNRYFIPPQIKPQTYNCENLTFQEVYFIKK